MPTIALRVSPASDTCVRRAEISSDEPGPVIPRRPHFSRSTTHAALPRRHP